MQHVEYSCSIQHQTARDIILVKLAPLLAQCDSWMHGGACVYSSLGCFHLPFFTFVTQSQDSRLKPFFLHFFIIFFSLCIHFVVNRSRPF